MYNNQSTECYCAETVPRVEVRRACSEIVD